MRTKENEKANKAETTLNFHTLSTGGARLGMIEVLGRPEGASCVSKILKKKEIVQYHPSRGKP